MGNCANFVKKAIGPKTVLDLSNDEVRTILKNALRLTDAQVWLDDRDYSTYKREDLIAFLKVDNTDSYKYVKEGFDCDDFAKVMVGREKEWYEWSQKERGSAFGIVRGDIRKYAPFEYSPHAMNVYIDENRKVWLVEPQSDGWYEPNDKSTYWLVDM